VKRSSLAECNEAYADFYPAWQEDNNREDALQRFSHSVIFQGDILEHDEAKKWCTAEFGPENSDSKSGNWTWLFYSKTGYDYGFFEYFFSEENEKKKFEDIVESLAADYPNGQRLRTDGPGKVIEVEK
jgi:hypothetical protein